MSEWGVLVVIFSRLCRQMEPLACQLSSAEHTFRAGIEGSTLLIWMASWSMIPGESST